MRDLKADLEICNKATPGPWRVSGDINHLVFAENGCSGEPIALIADCGQLHHADTKEHVMEMQANAAFIAAARTGWPESLERAIKAESKNTKEYEFLYNAFDKVKDEAEQLKEDNTALREENDLQRHSIQQLSAQVAECQDALKKIHRFIHPHNSPRYSSHIDNICDSVIYNPNPGADLLAKIEKLEAAAEAAKEFDRQIMRDRYTSQGLKRLWEKDVRQALVDLEGEKS